MRALGITLTLSLSSLCVAPAHAGTATAPILVKVKFGAADSGRCRSAGTDGQVTCELQPGSSVVTLDGTRQWSSQQTARRGFGSDALWKVAGSPDLEPVDGVYGAYATSRVVKYGGVEFVELTLNW